MAVRKQARGDSRPEVVNATCGSFKDKREIMKSKAKLKDNRQYERLFIENDTPRSERSQISNLM